jgi:hypothetical protein
MRPNIEAIQALIDERFGGNRSRFAEAIGVDRTQVTMILNKGVGVGKLFIGGMMSYCKANNLNFDDFFFYPQCEKS